MRSAVGALQGHLPQQHNVLLMKAQIFCRPAWATRERWVVLAFAPLQEIEGCVPPAERGLTASLLRLAVDCGAYMCTIHFLSDLDTLPYDNDNFAIGTCC